MKVKIGQTELNLNTYYRSNYNQRPSIVFDISDNYEKVYALAKIENQTFVVEVESQLGNSEVVDLSNECKIFSELTNKEDVSCILTMSKKSELEEANQNVEDLTMIVDAFTSDIN